MSLLVEPGYGAEQAHALFAEVYSHWRTLPKDNRPKLYLYGLSLGALSSELSNELFEVLGDPYHGALWSGPPLPQPHLEFDHPRPQSGIAGMAAAVPRWFICPFHRTEDALDIPHAEWGPLRIVYLQYASDPITFYNPHSLYHEPDWMKTPRGPDVSPDLRWYSVVTFLQLTLDVAMATTAPMGYGHVYAAALYRRVDAGRRHTGLVAAE